MMLNIGKIYGMRIMLMTVNEALELAIDTLEKDRMYFTFASDSDFSDKYRAKLAEAIKILSSMTVEEVSDA